MKRLGSSFLFGVLAVLFSAGVTWLVVSFVASSDEGAPIGAVFFFLLLLLLIEIVHAVILAQRGRVRGWEDQLRAGLIAYGGMGLAAGLLRVLVRPGDAVVGVAALWALMLVLAPLMIGLPALSAVTLKRRVFFPRPDHRTHSSDS